MTQYIFLKTIFKPISLALSIIFISILLIMKPYISLYNKITKIKTRMMTYIVLITSIKEMDSNIKTYAISKKKTKEN